MLHLSTLISHYGDGDGLLSLLRCHRHSITLPSGLLEIARHQSGLQVYFLSPDPKPAVYMPHGGHQSGLHCKRGEGTFYIAENEIFGASNCCLLSNVPPLFPKVPTVWPGR